MEDAIDSIGVRTRQYGFYSKQGHTIWEEPRGLWAGYRWPQYSVHRGKLQMLLYDTLIERAGPECISTGQRATGFISTEAGAVLSLENAETGIPHKIAGKLIVAADGIHSAIRSQLVPDEGAPLWNGAILWRAASLAPPLLGPGAMALAGHDAQRFVSYPISDPDPQTGLVKMNWIAELRVDPSKCCNREDWNRVVHVSDLLHYFESWRFDWLDIPALMNRTEQVFEYPMVDRDPLNNWTVGHVTLMGDAAHPTYPVGSNGATQAIIDARTFGAALLSHGLTNQGLVHYENQMR
ncbi:MAG: FAD-dependent monooxygenase, partial [Paracoccaceae bacterium]